jgi:cytochrome b pre-mRNA-processing protein 3
MIALWNTLFGRPSDDPEARCYARLAVQARRSEFYRWWGVPDTLDGRFELLALHAFLVFHRLKRQGEDARRFSRRLFEVMVTDIDRSVRGPRLPEDGTWVPVRALARACNRRIHAYDCGLGVGGDGPGPDGGGTALVAALTGNLYGTVLVPETVVLGMASYVGGAAAALVTQPLEQLLAGGVRFPEPPVPARAPADRWWAGAPKGKESLS